MEKQISDGSLVPTEELFDRIFTLRGLRVIFDFDLAELYGIEVKALKQAVRRNRSRFPEDFMLEITEEEWLRINGSAIYRGRISLRSQIVTLKNGTRGQHQKYKPFAFTEQGVAMLSSVIHNSIAIAINIEIMRVFVKMRQMIINYSDILEKIETLEASQIANNEQISNIYQIIKELIEPAVRNRPPIGFKITK